MASFISEVRSFSKLCWLSEWHVVEMQKYIIKSSNRHTDYHYASCVCLRERPLNQGPVVMLTTMSSEDSDWPEPCSLTAHIVWITLWLNRCLIAVYTLLWCVCMLSFPAGAHSVISCCSEDGARPCRHGKGKVHDSLMKLRFTAQDGSRPYSIFGLSI